MKRLFFAVCLAALAANCQSPAATHHQSPETQTVNPGSPDSSLSPIDYIIFGKFCGNCPKDCATMFLYSRTADADTLCLDRSDYYFYSSVRCDERIDNTELRRLAGEVYRHIPRSMRMAEKNEQSFGCPDCMDQCGYYLELKSGGRVKKFRMDAITSQLEGDVRAFTDYLIPVFDKMVALHGASRAKP